MIEAVGFYVPEENDNFDIYVCDEYGQVIAMKTGIVNPPMGYHTFRLDTPAALHAGHDFSIEVRVDGPRSDYTYVCAEMPFTDYSSRAIANDNEGFVGSRRGKLDRCQRTVPGHQYLSESVYVRPGNHGDEPGRLWCEQECGQGYVDDN